MIAKRFSVAFLIIVFFLASPASLLANENKEKMNAQKITNNMMKVIHPSSDTCFDLKIFNCDQKKSPCTIDANNEKILTLRVYVGDFTPGRLTPTKTLVHFLDPANVKGRLILYENQRTWIYFPGTQTPVRIPREQQILGDVDVGAILDIDYRLHYKPKLIENTSRDFSDDYAIEFTDDTGIEQHPRVVLWINKETYIPHKGEYYSLTGKLLKTAYFRNPGKLEKRYSYTRIDIYSIFGKPNKYTSIVYLNAQESKLKSYYYKSSQMKRFSQNSTR